MSAQNYKDIPGWGMDADPENEPTYPIKNYTGDDHKRINYERSEQQPANVEILKSNERPGLTAVFGTTVPPSGLSGVIRRYAFKHSEDRYRHWLPLILADRINILEGVIDDIKDGRFPNIIAERGYKAEWKYNRLAVIRKLVIGAVVAAVVWSSINKKHK
ncbi:hypothetical protein ACFQZI_05865 [Mucilaginibacter lutimaris]|uniref:Uncharacterized protein n=1 Tax=Mucilaginibacter lutimaris TaxID=931629 RepID=A0ABW2ZDV9_9SPHI